MNIFSKSNRSIADVAAKVMNDNPAKVEDYKPKQPLNTTMVDQVMRVGVSPVFDINKTLKEDKNLVLRNPSQDPTESQNEDGQFELDHTPEWPSPKEPLEQNKTQGNGWKSSNGNKPEEHRKSYSSKDTAEDPSPPMQKEDNLAALQLNYAFDLPSPKTTNERIRHHLKNRNKGK
jgi:hypothetical protein